MSQSQKPLNANWCFFFIRLCDFSFLPPLWLWLCVSSCLRTFRVSPLMCCCSSVLLNISHRHIWSTEKGLQLIIVIHTPNCLIKCSLISLCTFLWVVAEHMIVFWGPSLAYWRSWRSSQGHFLKCGVFSLPLYCLWSHHTACVTHCPSALKSKSLFCVCYNTCLHHFCWPW